MRSKSCRTQLGLRGDAAVQYHKAARITRHSKKYMGGVGGPTGALAPGQPGSSAAGATIGGSSTARGPAGC